MTGSAIKLREILNRYPELTADPADGEWLAGSSDRWVGHVRTTRHDGRGWWALHTLVGEPPASAAPAGRGCRQRTQLLVPMIPERAAELQRASVGSLQPSAAERCLEIVERGELPPPARLILVRGVAGERFALEMLWDPEVALAFERLPGAARNERRLDPWIADQLDAFVARHDVEVRPGGRGARRPARAEHREALPRGAPLARQSRGADRATAAAVLGGELAPFQWAAVRYALRGPRAVSWPTSRAWARRSRRSPHWRPTAPSRRWSSVRRR